MIFSDSIVALSSGRLPAGVAVVRVSGPETRFVIETIAGILPEPRVAVFRRLRDADGGTIDHGIVLFFPGPNSFTGEDVAEFQVHGGKASVSALLDRLTAFEGVRHAEAGEFTRRAFLNGKLDLPQTEALADLINAETEAQRRFAAGNADGAQGRLYQSWRKRLIHARAMIEAEIDFADEDDVPGSVADAVTADMGILIGEIESHVEGFRAAEIIRDGFEVVILGPPNAGKSSLLNALARRDVAIVTDEPGTTRDLLEVSLDLNGLYVRIVDTAGLREAAGAVEAIGIERAKTRARDAHLVLLLHDMAGADQIDPAGVGSVPILHIGTKADLEPSGRDKPYELVLSARTGAGLTELTDEIARRAKAQVESAGDILPSRLRHVELLRDTLGFLRQAVERYEERDVQAEMLRLATDRLGRIVGAVDVEDLLDVIFGQFCIGK
ncbi:tRNA uridine-5-carboxymethylaminomethyl(34) synthesis GTPase MnmE [Ollibium composti]|uniref:tRNA modification GTPase MnmE n=1 Tax=Ollibium composti TaxID=2675109 RepID=A0ABY2Q6B2_9HYPH|nr:tRNA uridine-5-carboxymethylaminomethyl(34) synthesis GTPase MnmE [Mesorhizobium composti]THF57061.1 tRNA uridine-5-carboxymethylaminomethyl(34) synthesis GTPase MnmE [Mesorhizobium composti]